MPEEANGLRERKKVRTRLAIRHAAFELFAKQGYTDTTVEQIAAAADISPRTFYRYFAGKETVLINDELVDPIVEAFAKAPQELSVVAAYRHGLAEVFGALSTAEREAAATAQRLMYEIPEASSLLYSDYTRLIDSIAEAMDGRHDAPADAATRRVLAGAIVGVLISAAHGTPMPEDSLSAALQILETQLSPRSH